MNCAFDKEKLSGYYDGELTAAEKSEVERHIASCSECLRDLGELKSAALMVKELPRLRAPKSIAEGVSREIQAAGKVHSMAKFRRLVLWASAAAAAVFVVANMVVLTQQKSRVAMEPPMARVKSAAPEAPARAAEQAVPQFGAEAKPADRADDKELAARRQLELRKDTGGEAGEKRTAAQPMEEAKKVDALRERSEAPAAPPTKPGEALAKAEPAPAAPAAAPPAPAKSAAPASNPVPPDSPKPEAAAFADKAKEAEANRKPDGDLKNKVASVGAPADLPPAQFNVLTKELAKARPRIEDSLKRMGLTMPPVPSQPMKQPRNREAENTIVLELTEAQFLRLREDLEKPGDARIVTASSVEPVLGAFRGGLYAKKDASAGARAPAPTAKEKDAKDPEDAKALSDPNAGPKRKVTLHLIESSKIPPPDDAVPLEKK